MKALNRKSIRLLDLFLFVSILFLSACGSNTENPSTGQFAVESTPTQGEIAQMPPLATDAEITTEFATQSEPEISEESGSLPCSSIVQNSIEPEKERSQIIYSKKITDQLADLFAVYADGSGDRNLTSEITDRQFSIALEPSCSADGSLVIYYSGNGITLININDSSYYSNYQAADMHVSSPQWTPNSFGFVGIGTDDATSTDYLTFFDPATGQYHRDFGFDRIQYFSISPDSDHLRFPGTPKALHHRARKSISFRPQIRV